MSKNTVSRSGLKLTPLLFPQKSSFIIITITIIIILIIQCIYDRECERTC